MKLKKIFKKIFPEKSYDFFRNFSQKLFFFNYVYSDYSYILFSRSSNKAKISDIIRQYHRLEKAMSKIPFNPKRGQRAAYSLITLLEKYKKENKKKDVQFYVAVKVLHSFFQKSQNLNSEIFLRLKKISETNENLKVGVENTSIDYFKGKANSNFEELAISRKSIRYFSKEPVSIDLLYKAFDIAKKTPSVCNRQGWHTWIVTQTTVLDTFKKVHNGFSDESQNLTRLLIVTFDKNAFDYPIERNQGFMDAGLYAMSLMYSLTHLGIASCPLNSNMGLKQRKLMKKVAGIPDNYTLAMFIAVGNYLESNPSPISHRYSAEEKTSII